MFFFFNCREQLQTVDFFQKIIQGLVCFYRFTYASCERLASRTVRKLNGCNKKKRKKKVKICKKVIINSSKEKKKGFPLVKKLRFVLFFLTSDGCNDSTKKKSTSSSVVCLIIHTKRTRVNTHFRRQHFSCYIFE